MLKFAYSHTYHGKSDKETKQRFSNDKHVRFYKYYIRSIIFMIFINRSSSIDSQQRQKYSFYSLVIVVELLFKLGEV